MKIHCRDRDREDCEKFLSYLTAADHNVEWGPPDHFRYERIPGSLGMITVSIDYGANGAAVRIDPAKLSEKDLRTIARQLMELIETSSG